MAKRVRKAPQKVVKTEIIQPTVRLIAGGKEVEIDELSAVLACDRAWLSTKERKHSKEKVRNLMGFLEEAGATGVTFAEAELFWELYIGQDAPSDNSLSSTISIEGQDVDIIELKMTFETVEEAWGDQDKYTPDFVAAITNSVKKEFGIEASMASIYWIWRRLWRRILELKKSMSETLNSRSGTGSTPVN